MLNFILLVWAFTGLSGCVTGHSPTLETLELLTDQRNEKLYYEDENFPAPVKELISHGDLKTIANAYLAGHSDQLVRFNIIMIINKKLESRQTAGKKVHPEAKQALLAALKDSFSWVRTEAAWGIGKFGTKKDRAALLPLLDDSDTNVVNESLLALDKIHGKNKDVTSAQDLPEKERQNLIQMWKLRLK